MGEELRLSRRNILDAIVNLATTGDLYFVSNGIEYDLPVEALLEFAEHEIELLDIKNDRAKERLKEKRVEGEELAAAVYDALTDEFLTVAEITPMVNYPDVTPQKVIYRLSQLYKAGYIEKSSITIPAESGYKPRTFATYRK